MEKMHSLVGVRSEYDSSTLVWKFNDVVTWKTRFYAFTSFKRAEIEWENTFEPACVKVHHG